MKTEICFIRHGETSWNQEGRIQGTIDNPLNDDGIREAINLANHLKTTNPNWDILIASPLSRAKQTARQIQKALGLPTILEEKRFIERQFGKAEGVVITKALYQGILEETVAGLEPGLHLQERVYNATMDFVHQYHQKRILVVAHSHVIKALLMRLNPEYSFKTSIKNLSLTTFVFEESLEIKQVNEVVL